MGVVFGEFPGAVAAEGDAGEVGAVGVGVELFGFLVEGGHGELEHFGVGPEMAQGALGQDDDEGPALGVVAELLGKADLGLPEAFAAAFAAAVEEKQNRRGLLAFFVFGALIFRAGLRFVEVFGEVDLEVVGDAFDFDGAVEEAGFLEGFLKGLGGVGFVLSADGGQGGAQGAGGESGADEECHGQGAPQCGCAPACAAECWHVLIQTHGRGWWEGILAGMRGGARGCGGRELFL